MIRRCIENQAFAQNRLVRMYQTSWRKSLITNGALGRHRDGWFGAGRTENWQPDTGRVDLVDGRQVLTIGI